MAKRGPSPNISPSDIALDLRDLEFDIMKYALLFERPYPGARLSPENPTFRLPDSSARAFDTSAIDTLLVLIRALISHGWKFVPYCGNQAQLQRASNNISMFLELAYQQLGHDEETDWEIKAEWLYHIYPGGSKATRSYETFLQMQRNPTSTLTFASLLSDIFQPWLGVDLVRFFDENMTSTSDQEHLSKLQKTADSSAGVEARGCPLLTKMIQDKLALAANVGSANGESRRLHGFPRWFSVNFMAHCQITLKDLIKLNLKTEYASPLAPPSNSYPVMFDYSFEYRLFAIVRHADFKSGKKDDIRLYYKDGSEIVGTRNGEEVYCDTTWSIESGPGRFSLYYQLADTKITVSSEIEDSASRSKIATGSSSGNGATRSKKRPGAPLSTSPHKRPKIPSSNFISLSTPNFEVGVEDVLSRRRRKR